MELLAIWEGAAAARPDDRDNALLAALPEPPARSLSARNASLLQLRARLFGPLQQLRSNCPECGEIVEFAVDCDKLSRAAGAGKTIGVGGYALAPANMNHFAYTTAPTTIVLYGIGPVEFKYVNPNDDPRNHATK